VTDDEAFSWQDDDEPPKSVDGARPRVKPPAQTAPTSAATEAPKPPAQAPGSAVAPAETRPEQPAAQVVEPPEPRTAEPPEPRADTPASSSDEPRSAAAIRAEIRKLKRKLADLEPAADAPPAGPREPVETTTPAERDEETRRSLVSSQVFARHLRQFGRRRRTEPVDVFGLDPVYESRLKRVLDFMHSTYFRVEVDGIHHVPDEGRCLIVANHSGGPIPYDGLMLRTAMRREHPAARELRWLTEDFIHHLPFVGTAMSRLGAVRACQQNAQRLLGEGCLVAVFPEGAKGIGRLFKNRYRLRRFGRGGYVRLCIRTSTPLVPCALVGPEEANPTLFKLETVARYLGVPHVPITPTFPLLGPAGLLPAPTKWKLRFGDPIRFDEHPPEAADDEVLVGRLSDRVRATIQAMLDDTLAKRRSVFFG